MKNNSDFQHHESTSKKYKSPILFIHGAWHGAWCWREKFVPYFNDNGFDVYTFNLSGHGIVDKSERINRLGLSQYVKDVEHCVREIGQSPIIIGHSMGGFILQKYLQKEVCEAAIFMNSVPPNGTLIRNLKLLGSERNLILPFLKGFFTWSLYPLVNSPHKAKMLFFSDSMSDLEVRKFSTQLQNESWYVFARMWFGIRSKKIKANVPVLSLSGELDQIFNKTDSQRLAKKYNGQHIEIADSAHDMMLESNYEATALAIKDWIIEKLS